jgi:hypothetical protein
MKEAHRKKESREDLTQLRDGINGTSCSMIGGKCPTT